MTKYYKTGIGQGINRIRLEFKVVRKDTQGRGGLVLIESDWNLKLFSLYGIGWPVICINRIRLEFKENKIGEGVKSWDSINRIRLEFKVLAMSRPLSFAHTY